MDNIYAIIAAGGRGVRMGSGRPKQLLDLDGKPILVHTLGTFCGFEELSGILLVLPTDFRTEALRMLEDFMDLESFSGPEPPSSPDGSPWFRIRVPVGALGGVRGGHKPIRLVAGGVERQDSVLNALRQLPAHCGWVVIHDGVRPFASLRLIRSTFEAAMASGAAVAAVPSTDTVKRVEDGQVAETLPREAVWLVQTPQVFRKDLILEAYGEALRRGWTGTDDASLVERLGHPVTVVLGERFNIKVTIPEDLEWGASFLERCRRGRPAA